MEKEKTLNKSNLVQVLQEHNILNDKQKKQSLSFSSRHSISALIDTDIKVILNASFKKAFFMLIFKFLFKARE